MLNASDALAGEPTYILGSMVMVMVPVMGSLSLQRQELPESQIHQNKGCLFLCETVLRLPGHQAW